MRRSRNQFFVSSLPTDPPSIAGRAFGCLKPFAFLFILIGLCAAVFYFGNPISSLDRIASPPEPITLTQAENVTDTIQLDLVQATAYDTDTIKSDSLLADLLAQQPPEPKRITMLWSPFNLLGEEEESAVPLMVLTVDGSLFTGSDLDGDIWKCNYETLKVEDCQFVEWVETAPNDGLAASAAAIIKILAREAESDVKAWANNR